MAQNRSLYDQLQRNVKESQHVFKTDDRPETADERAREMAHWQEIEGNPLTPGEITHLEQMHKHNLSPEEKLEIILKEINEDVQR